MKQAQQPQLPQCVSKHTARQQNSAHLVCRLAQALGHGGRHLAQHAQREALHSRQAAGRVSG